MPEGPPSPEKKEGLRGRVVEALKNKGPEDAEAKELLIAWTKQREAEANRINTSKVNIEVNIDRARLYADAGYLEDALDVLNSAYEQAMNEQELQLVEKINEMMYQMEEIYRTEDKKTE